MSPCGCRASSWFRPIAVLTIFALTLGGAVGADPTSDQKGAHGGQIESSRIEGPPPTFKNGSYIRPGLVIDVLSVEISGDRRPIVRLKLSDDLGVALDREGRLTPGPISLNFILAWYDAERRQYVNYSTQIAVSGLNGASAGQANRDVGGAFEDPETGVTVYAFNTVLPENYDQTKTHTLAIYATRDLQDINEKTYYANVLHDFRPDGGDVEETWSSMTTETCNTCHDPLAEHGGSRRDVKLCVTCHNQQTTDPDTGNLLDMKVMIHKIHRGEDLPSVQAGKPYQIIGFRNAVHDYSTVIFPQDSRNCASCHPDSSPEGHIWYSRPGRDACGSCHDQIDWVTGEGHRAGPAADDSECARCHEPVGDREFDNSVIGAHTIPVKSRQLPGLNIEITGVTNATPGQNPTVHFSLKNNDGSTIEPASLPFFNLLLAGPSEDYRLLVSERAVEGSVPDGSGFAYTFSAVLPEDPGGTYTIGAEAFRNITLNPGTRDEMQQRETAVNPVYYFLIGEGEAHPRRTVVSDANCENCHNDLALHGGIRRNSEYCVMCHQTMADDSPFRESEDFPARSIDFKFLIHRIHKGEELTRDYTIIGFNGSRHNYNEVRYPGDLKNCSACHVGDSYQIPSPGIEETPEPYEFFSPIPPNSAACLSCHDTLDARLTPLSTRPRSARLAARVMDLAASLPLIKVMADHDEPFFREDVFD